MRFGRRVLTVAATVIGAGGILFAGPGTGCIPFVAESALVATDFCFVFDCQNGILAGTVDPCSGAGSGDQTLEGNGPRFPLFTDCPNAGP